MNVSGKLYLIPSTIAEGTADVIPEFNRKIIKTLDYFLVENVRSARRFISSLQLAIKIEEIQFELFNKKTSYEEIIELLMPVKSGTHAGVLSEAGCPGVADPGSVAVDAAHQLGIKVVPLIGPSSILLALMASGFSGQSFAFHGYLPIENNARNKSLKELEHASLKTGQTQIFMETPYRNNQMVKALLETCHPGTKLCIAAGISGENENIVTNSIGKWRKMSLNFHKTPCIFLIGR